MKRAGVFSGTVRAEGDLADASPLPALVKLLDRDTNRVLIDYADRSGRFSLPGVIPGRFHLEVTVPGDDAWSLKSAR